MPSGLTHSHPNAFHVWDQDDVVIPLSLEHNPQVSPFQAVIPFIPHFFPSHSVINSPAPQIQWGETKSPNRMPQEAYVFPSPKNTEQRCAFSNVSFHDRRDDKVWLEKQSHCEMNVAYSANRSSQTFNLNGFTIDSINKGFIYFILLFDYKCLVPSYHVMINGIISKHMLLTLNKLDKSHYLPVFAR